LINKQGITSCLSRRRINYYKEKLFPALQEEGESTDQRLANYRDFPNNQEYIERGPNINKLIRYIFLFYIPGSLTYYVFSGKEVKNKESKNESPSSNPKQDLDSENINKN
jgi:hypothetical protein